MVRHFPITATVAVCLFLLAGLAGEVSSQGLTYLTVVNNPRATGMGGCVINLVDEQSPLYNPGGLGLFHLEKTAAVSTPIIKTKLVPDLADDIWFSTYGVSYGLPLDGLNSGGARKRNTAVGGALFRTSISYGLIQRSGEGGVDLGTWSPEETSVNFSAGVGLNLRGRVRIGLGATVKFYKSALVALGDGIVEATGKAYDIGLIAEFPLHGLSSDSILSVHSSDNVWEFTPSVAFVKANMGGDVSWHAAHQSDPLPAEHRLGVSVLAALRNRVSRMGSLRVSYQMDKDLVDEKVAHKAGVELGLYEILYLRSGYGKPSPGDRESTVTIGAGLHSIGIMKLLRDRGKETTEPKGLLQNANVALDVAFYSGDAIGLDGTCFLRVDLSM